MTAQEIRERWAGESPHRCPECNARPHRESDVLWLLAEVDRLNRILENGWGPDALRKCMESEVADK